MIAIQYGCFAAVRNQHGGHRADHAELAVHHVDDAAPAKDHRQAHADQGVDEAVGDAGLQPLEDETERGSADRRDGGGVGCRRLPCPGNAGWRVAG